MLFQNFGRLVALVGGGLAGICIGWVGVLWMTSGGEPMKVAQARMALVGVLGGLVLCGLAFGLPRAVSEVVIEPSGGIVVENRVGMDCDRLLRKQLVHYRTASTGARMQEVVKQIQVKRGQCGPDVWNPVVKTGVVPTACFQGSGTAVLVGGVPLPSVFYEDDGGLTRPKRVSVRDSSNNVLVYWSDDMGERPSDGSLCWLYLAALERWGVSGTVGGGTPPVGVPIVPGSP